MTMQITRLRVEQLRQFRQPFELSGFEPGLNIFSGPNEAGKSTLVRAIRAAFFERHRSTAVDDLRPWGDSAATPSIELNFTLAGQPHQLSKSFLGKKRCTLRTGTQTLEGPEAEDHLAQVFGFAFAGKGASKAEHWGIPGLLWVEQGTGQELDVSHARDHLHDALRGQADDGASALAATGGDELLEQLRAQRNELLTQAGKPRAALAEAIAQAQALTGQLQVLDQQIATYRQQVDQLASLRGQHQADEAQRPWEALRTELQAAQTRQQALQAAQGQLATDQSRLSQLEQTRELLLAQLNTHAQQQEAAGARQQALAGATAQLETADAARATARQQAEAAQARASAARDALRLARQEATRQGLTEQLAEARTAADGIAQALQRAEQEHERLAALRQSAALGAIGQAEVKQLRALERAVREAALRRQAVATRLQFALQAGQSITLQGATGHQPLSGQGECLLDAPAMLQLPGLGELTITPGGQDLAELARQHGAAQDQLRAALQGLGLADLAEAEARLASHTELQGQIRLAEQALAIVAPKGLEPLRAQSVQAGARIQTTQDALARLPAPAANPVLPQAQAEAELEAADAAEQAAASALAQAERQQASAHSRCEEARRELAAAQSVLADPARQQRQAEARQQLLATQAEHAALAARIEQARAELLQARPDIVTQDIQRLQRSIEQLEHQHRQRREQILLLENTLQQAGAQGLEEQRDAAAGELARAQRRQDELQRRAAALELLCGKLDAKRQATLDRLQAPLQARLQHYLQLLFPGARLDMAEDLAPGTLTRQGAAGAVESGSVGALSFGAREQLGLISRLAYADLLRDAGRPTLLILDDALVHSDDTRLARMKRVIFDAAQRHQVLLFTCHPGHWRDMGVAVRQELGTPGGP